MVVIVVVGVVVVVLVVVVVVVVVVGVVVVVMMVTVVFVVVVMGVVVVVDLRICLLPLSEAKDAPDSVVILGMNILSCGRRHTPQTGLMDMPRNVFRLTPSFVTVACPNKADVLRQLFMIWI